MFASHASASVAAALGTGGNAGKWVATYTLTTGTINDADNVVRVTVTDTAGNSNTPVADDTLAVVDNMPAAALTSASTSATNLFLQSQTLDITPVTNVSLGWSNTNSNTQKDRAVAPDGTQTAEVIVANTSTAQHISTQAFASGSYSSQLVVGQPYTVSYYVKAVGTLTRVQVLDSVSAAGVLFDIVNGTVVSQAANRSGAIQSVGDGWYRISMTYSPTTDTNTPVLYLRDPVTTNTSLSWTGNGTAGIALWGAQFEAGRVATAYVPTTTATASADTTLTASELARGLAVKVDASNATAGDKIEIGTVSNGTFTSLATPQYSAALTGPNATASVTLRDVDGTLLPTDGAVTLATRLVDSRGNAGEHTSLGSYTVSTAVGSMAAATPNAVLSNLALRSEDIGLWSQKSGFTVQSNVLQAPDGSNTAELLLETTATAQRPIANAMTGLTVGQTYTASYYVKAYGGTTAITLSAEGVSGMAVFNLATGTVLDSSNKSTMTDVGNGWYRVSQTFDAVSTTQRHIVYGGSYGASYAGNTSNGLYLWGAQYETGSVVTAYQPTTSSAIASTDTTLTAAELVNGLSIKVSASTATLGDRVELGYLSGGVFTSFAERIYSRALTGATNEVVIHVQDDATRNIADGSYQLVTRLVNAQGETGIMSAPLSVTVSTSVASMASSTPSVTLTQLALESENAAAVGVTGQSGIDRVQNNATAPNGTLTAESLMQLATTGQHVMGLKVASLEAGQVYTQSYYVKPVGALTRVAMLTTMDDGAGPRVGGYTGVYFDLIDGGSVALSHSGFKGEISKEDNGWYRISVTYTAYTTGDVLNLNQVTTGTSNYSFAGVTTDGVAVWGGQSVLGDGFMPHVLTTGTAATTNTTLNAQELASGFGLQVDVASAAVGDRVEVGYLVNGNFTSLSTPAYSRELTGAVSKLNITVDGAAELADGNYTLVTRLVNALGQAGVHSTTGVVVDAVIDAGNDMSLVLGDFDVINDDEDESNIIYTVTGLDDDVKSSGAGTATLSDGTTIITATTVNTLDSVITFNSNDIKTLSQGLLTLTLKVTDAAGNQKSIVNNNIKYENIAPSVVSKTSGAIDANADLNIKFNDPELRKNVGEIDIFTSNGLWVETVNVTSERITVSNGTVTINPVNSLNSGSYYAIVDYGAFVDVNGNKTAGIHSGTGWVFDVANLTTTIDFGGENIDANNSIHTQLQSAFIIHGTLNNFDNAEDVVITNITFTSENGTSFILTENLPLLSGSATGSTWTLLNNNSWIGQLVGGKNYTVAVNIQGRVDGNLVSTTSISDSFLFDAVSHVNTSSDSMDLNLNDALINQSQGVSTFSFSINEGSNVQGFQYRRNPSENWINVSNIDSQNRTFNVPFAYSEQSPVVIQIRSHYNDGSFSQPILSHEVSFDLAPPVFYSPHDLYALEGSIDIYTAIAVDQGGAVGNIRYRLLGDDAQFFQLNQLSGELSFKDEPTWIPPIVGQDNNQYDIVIQAIDGVGNITNHDLHIRVVQQGTDPTNTPQGLLELFRQAGFGEAGRTLNPSAEAAYKLAFDENMQTKDQVSRDGTANQANPEKRLIQYIDQVTGTDIVSATEWSEGFVITGKATAGLDNIKFYLDNNRTDRVQEIGNELISGQQGVTIEYDHATGNFVVRFAAESSALMKATHNTYGSGVHQLTVDSDGNGVQDIGEASRLFLVASGTAQIGDAGLVSQNYSIQDTITNNVFVYYYGDPDGEGLGIWTRFDKDEPVIPNYSVDSDMDSKGWLDWDYYNTPGLPFGTQATVENTAMGYVTSVAPQIWEFQMAPSNIRYLSTVAESVAADHVFWNSNTSRMPSAEEMLALYAANFGGDLGGHGWPSGPASTVGNIQPMTDESTNNKYTDIESNRPGGFLADYWSTARTFWGRLDFNIYEGHLFDFPEVTSRGVAPIL